MKFCYHCMAEINDDEARFCPQCGNEYDVHYSQSFELPAGTILNNGRYLVGKSLGSGGFGISYIGYDLTLRKKIVVKETYYSGLFNRNNQNKTLSDPLKVTYDSSISLDEIMEKARKECYSLSKAESFNNIVKVYDLFSENNTAYIITEYITGDTLYDYVTKNGAYSWRELYQKMRPLMVSLANLHEQDLLHRDIKPQNIMIKNIPGEGETFVLIDFGLARSAKTKTLASMGIAFSPGYSPFEQRTLTKKDGTYTDVYALAATMYFALTGEPPEDEISTNLLENFPRLKGLKKVGKINNKVYNAFMSALQPDYRLRCQTIDDFLAELEENNETIVASPYDSNYQWSGNVSELTQLSNSNDSQIQSNAFSSPQSASQNYSTQKRSVQKSSLPVSRNVKTEPVQPATVPQQPPVVIVESPKRSGVMTFAVALISILLVSVVVLGLVKEFDIIDIFNNSAGTSENADDTDSNIDEQIADDSESDINLDDYVEIKDYIGYDIDGIKKDLEDQGLKVTYSTDPYSDYPDGTVLKQSIEPGMYQKIGKTINFVVAKEKEQKEEKEEDETVSKSNVAVVNNQSKPQDNITSVPSVVSKDEEYMWKILQDKLSSELTTDEDTTNLLGTYSKPIFHEITASSRLVLNDGYDYSEQNAAHHNGNCWSEGVDGNGVGEYVMYYDSKVQTFSQCSIFNGYNKSSTAFQNNGRLTKVTFEFDDGSQLTYDLNPDDMGEQVCYFGKIIHSASIKVIIAGVKEGEKYQDTCISCIVPQ